MKIQQYSIIFFTILSLIACQSQFELTPYSEFAPSNVLTNEKGLKAVLYSAHASIQNTTASRILINISEVSTDMAYNTGGAENLYLQEFVNFTWSPSTGNFRDDVWAPHYRAVRDANLVLENVNNVQGLSDASKKLYIAEAKTLRAFSYDVLRLWFGGVPLRKSSADEAQKARATDDEMKQFIESEYLASIADLPAPGKEEAYSRINKGVVYAMLTKFYLNTKQWQKAADAAKSVMDLGYYSLFTDYTKMFRVENEGNKEMILVKPARNENGYGNWFSAGALPPGFKTSSTIPEFVWTTSMANFATQYRLRTKFTSSFDPQDARLGLIIRNYTNTSGAQITLGTDDARSLKYWDNATLGNNSGNDVPVFRYADILLSRAEALNELNGPSQEAISLVNEVRKRAKVAELQLSNFKTKEELRAHILKERSWEFYSEGKSREDYIRHGVFISAATDRKVQNPVNDRLVFPIPQAETDANKLCVQNQGY
jgi:hypothetical protein